MVFILSEEYIDALNKPSYNIINLNDPVADYKITKMEDKSGYTAVVVNAGGIDKFLFNGNTSDECSKIIANIINYSVRNPEGVIDVKAFLIPDAEETKKYTLDEVNETIDEVLSLHGYGALLDARDKLENESIESEKIDNLKEQIQNITELQEESKQCQATMNALYAELDQSVSNGQETSISDQT